MSAIPDVAEMVQWILQALVALLLLAAPASGDSALVDADDTSSGMSEVHLQVPEAPLRMTTP